MKHLTRFTSINTFKTRLAPSALAAAVAAGLLFTIQPFALPSFSAPASGGEVTVSISQTPPSFGVPEKRASVVAQLRKKVERKPEEPETIITVHGVGYRCEM